MSDISIFIYTSFIFVLPVLCAHNYYERRGQCYVCDQRDPKPLRRINLEMIKGSWRCAYQKLPKGFSLNNVLNNFHFVIEAPLANGSGPGESWGRLPRNCQCVNFPSFLNFTGVSNTYTEISEFTMTLDGAVQWRFLDAFGPYMIGHYCLEFDTNERCLNSFVNIFTRKTRDVPLEDLKKLNKSLRQTTCLDIFEDMHQCSSGEDCPAARAL